MYTKRKLLFTFGWILLWRRLKNASFWPYTTKFIGNLPYLLNDPRKNAKKMNLQDIFHVKVLYRSMHDDKLRQILYRSSSIEKCCNYITCIHIYVIAIILAVLNISVKVFISVLGIFIYIFYFYTIIFRKLFYNTYLNIVFIPVHSLVITLVKKIWPMCSLNKIYHFQSGFEIFLVKIFLEKSQVIRWKWVKLFKWEVIHDFYAFCNTIH